MRYYDECICLAKQEAINNDRLIFYAVVLAYKYVNMLSECLILLCVTCMSVLEVHMHESIRITYMCK